MSHRITAVNHFNGVRVSERTYFVSSFAHLRNLARPSGEGWSRRLLMSERTARQFGAYETTSGQWIINYYSGEWRRLPDVRVELQDGKVVNVDWTEHR